MTYGKARKLAGKLMILFLVFVFLGFWKSVCFYLAIALCVIIGIICTKFYKCPHCGKPVHEYIFKQSQFCSYCGKQLD